MATKEDIDVSYRDLSWENKSTDGQKCLWDIVFKIAKVELGISGSINIDDIKGILSFHGFEEYYNKALEKTKEEVCLVCITNGPGLFK